MTKRQMPPGRNSKLCVVVVNPLGPHHCARCFGSVKAANTSSRGASNSRLPMIERGSVSRSTLFFTPTFSLLRLQGFEIVVESVEPLLPQATIAFEPIVNAFQGGRFEPARTPLRFTAARDQACVLQYLQVLGYGGPAHLERLCELTHRGLAQGEAREDGASGRICERGKRDAEAIGGHGGPRYLTEWLFNLSVRYATAAAASSVEDVPVSFDCNDCNAIISLLSC